MEKRRTGKKKRPVERRGAAKKGKKGVDKVGGGVVV